MSDFCDQMCPFLGCASCEYASGENPTTATVSDARTGVACETMGARKTAPAGNRGLTKDDARSRNG